MGELVILNEEDPEDHSDAFSLNTNNRITGEVDTEGEELNLGSQESIQEEEEE